MINDLDLYFPYIVLFYGAVMTLVTNLPGLREKASEQMNPEMLHWFYSHQALGTICVFVGGLWSIQRLFI